MSNQNQSTGSLITSLLINTISIFAVSYILSGFQIDSFHNSSTKTLMPA